MFRQDSLFSGIIAGILFPVMFGIIFWEINELLIEHVFQRGKGLSEQFLAILSVCSNLIPFVVFNRSDKERSMRGVLLVTFVMGFVLVILYARQFFLS